MSSQGVAWLVTGKTVGGTRIYPQANCLDRDAALRLWTECNTWFSSEDGKKGQLAEDQLADLAVLSDDYFDVPDDKVADITSVLTIVGGRVVHGSDSFDNLAPTLPRPMPDWSPVNMFGGHYRRERKSDAPKKVAAAAAAVAGQSCAVHGQQQQLAWFADIPAAHQGKFCSALGCNCWMS